MTDLLTETNPFATRRVRPGAIPMFFPPGQSASHILDRLRENGWWGEIVGPHGSGKSTLLAAMVSLLRQVGRRPIMFQLHDGERRLRGGWHRKTRRGDVLIVDGFEKIPLVYRLWIKRHCRRQGAGLLVTAHKTIGLPELYRTQATPELSRRVIGHLLKDQNRSLRPVDIAALLEARDGNLREVLFDLYDAFESTRRSALPGRSSSVADVSDPKH